VITLTVSKLAKRFGSRTVFNDISFDISTGHALAITGPNGSGKTTLLMTLLSQLRPTRGEFTFSENGTPLDSDAVRLRIGFVAPYLHLFDRLSAEENLKFFADMAGLTIPGKQIDELLRQVGLEGRGIDPVAEYSSGMKQRLKYALAIMKSPALLILDEPGSNLDERGKVIVSEIIRQHTQKSIVILATNEPEEATLAERQIRLGQ
jgi:heme exporter protein A